MFVCNVGVCISLCLFLRLHLYLFSLCRPHVDSANLSKQDSLLSPSQQIFNFGINCLTVDPVSAQAREKLRSLNGTSPFLNKHSHQGQHIFKHIHRGKSVLHIDTYDLMLCLHSILSIHSKTQLYSLSMCSGPRYPQHRHRQPVRSCKGFR